MFKSKKVQNKMGETRTGVAYEKIMEELMKAYVGSEIIEQVLNIEDLEKDSLPMRYRLIALGFLKQDTLEDLNDNLINNGCQPLYARSSFETTLIYAFANRLSFPEWKKIAKVCEEAKNNWEKSSDKQMFFRGKYITLRDLEEYVLSYSEKNDKDLVTKQITRVLDEEIRALGDDYSRFFHFYISNLQEFSDVREKTRYYFCKYLYYYILSKIDRYKKCVGNQIPNQEQLLELLPLKVESKLRRRKTDPEQLMDILRECAISPAAIFEEFNYYFFGYVSVDWVDLMLENISDVNELKDSQVEMIANYLRNSASKSELTQINEFRDKELVQNRIELLQKDEENGVTNRKGENAIRKYLRGDLDIDRTTLICFLLFWGSEETNRNEINISEERMNDILDECGFSMLRKKEPFDEFVINYIKSSDPVSYLMAEMDRYQERGESFFVYEVYSRSGSNAKEIRKSMSL